MCQPESGETIKKGKEMKKEQSSDEPKSKEEMKKIELHDPGKYYLED